jgi:tetratricopeptide (TPR) repeat protein
MTIGDFSLIQYKARLSIRRCVACGLAITALLLGTLPCRADQNLHQYFEQLRQRGLFALAEEYAQSHLVREDLPPDRRAMLTVSLSQALLDHGEVARGEERREFWNEAARQVHELLERDPRNPRRIELEAQAALLPALRGAALAWDVSVTPENASAREEAIELLRTGISRLEDWLKNRPAERPTEVELADGAPTFEETTLLERRVRLQIGWSYVHLAELLPPGRQRSAALLDGEEACSQIGRSRTRDDISIEGRLCRARIARLRGDADRAAGMLDALLRERLDPITVDRVLAERIRVELSRDDLDEALLLVRERSQLSGPFSDELRAAVVDVLLRSWKLAGEKGQTEFQEELLEQAEDYHRMTGGRWRQQTAASLRGIREDRELGEELAATVRQARWLYHQEQIDEALDRYAAAAAQADRSGMRDHAVEYGLTRASILIQRKEWAEAGAALSEILDRHAEHERAPEASLLLAYALGQRYGQDRSDANRQAYEAALEKHRDRFPDSATFYEATWMLAVHREQREEWTEALPLYREIDPVHQRHREAALRVLVLHEKVLDQLRARGEPLEEWEDRAVADVERIVSLRRDAEDRLTPLECQILIRGAQLLLQHRDRPYERADELLARAETAVRLASGGRQPPDPVWNRLDHAIAQLRIVALAGQERLLQAGRVLDRLGETDPAQMLQILRGLTELTAKVDPERQRDLGHLQHQAVRKLSRHRQELSPEQQRLLDECTAEAYVATLDLPEAARVYETMLEQSPGDRRLIERVISIYERRGQREDLEQAKGWWIRLERLEKAGTPEWIAARLNAVRLMLELGETDQARKLLGVTRTLYPDLGTPELKRQAEELLERLG